MALKEELTEPWGLLLGATACAPGLRAGWRIGGARIIDAAPPPKAAPAPDQAAAGAAKKQERPDRILKLSARGGGKLAVAYWGGGAQVRHRIEALGRSSAVDGWLTPAILEMAVRTERHHPQDLKKVWHYLARFGDRSSA